MTVARVPALEELIHRLDEAVAVRDDAACCRRVKQVLTDVIGRGERFLDAAFLRPAPDRYARRLVHRDPAGRYSVLAMVWDKGQGTGLHDHAGIWCVECVYEGRIRVTSYSVRGGDPERDLVVFEQEAVVTAGVGEAGALIPPFEYHTIANAREQASITLHVYGGDLTRCSVFEPEPDGLYRERHKDLAYDH